MTRWAARALALAVAALAVVGVWSAASASRPPTPLAEQTRAVSATLRCPTCAGESIADSPAPLAAAMRTTVSEQLADGRSPAQIRAWFAERYGSEVLLDPPPRGTALLLWLVPLAGVAAATAVVVRAAPGRRLAPAVAAALAVVAFAGAGWLAWRDGGPVPVTAAPAPQGDAVAALQRAVHAAPGDVDARLALGHALDDAGLVREAREEYAAAARLAPMDPAPAYLHAFALTRSGDPQAAVPVLERALGVSPQHPPSLLLLGTLLHDTGDQRGGDLLRDFLDAQPDHPAAERVRTLLQEPAP